MEESNVRMVLVGILTDPHKPKALEALYKPHYLREVICLETDAGGVAAKVFKRGQSRYKRRPHSTLPPPPVNCKEIKQALTATLPDGFTITAVEDKGDHVLIIMEERK